LFGVELKALGQFDADAAGVGAEKVGAEKVSGTFCGQKHGSTEETPEKVPDTFSAPRNRRRREIENPVKGNTLTDHTAKYRQRSRKLLRRHFSC
jgi:hypothetical protein